MIYDRQEELVSPASVVHIVGCGGVGAWAAILLALAGTTKLHLYDDDTVDESNLNRLPYPASTVGQSKVEVLRGLILHLRPDCEVFRHGRFNHLVHSFRDADYASIAVICAVDTMRDRQAVYQYAQEEGVRYVDVGAESHHCTVSPSPADWPLVEDRPGYFTPIWSAPVAVAAGLAVAAACLSLPGTLNLDLSSMSAVLAQDGPEQPRMPEHIRAALITNDVGVPIQLEREAIYAQEATDESEEEE